MQIHTLSLSFFLKLIGYSFQLKFYHRFNKSLHCCSFHGIIPNNNYVYKLKINLTYSVNNKLIPDFYSEVLGYYGLSAKNIKNSALFIINNIFSAYSYNKDSDSYFLKNNLHDNQQEIFEIINSTINHLNQFLFDALMSI